MGEVIEFPKGEGVQEKASIHLKLKINEKYRKLIRALNKEEFNGLEKEIIECGKATDPIITSNGYIIDGHHRYAICTKHGLPFKVEDRNFENENRVMRFIYSHQKSRRNLNEFERSYHALEINKLDQSYEAQKRVQSGGYECKGSVKHPAHHGGQGDLQNLNNDRSGRVDHILAKEAGVSHKTISQVSRIIDHASEETKQQLKEGNLSIRKAYSDIKREEVSSNSNFPKGEYRIIHADPYMRDTSLPCGWTDKPIEFTAGNLPIKDNLDSEDAVLFLWTPPRFIDNSLRLMKEWGFAYRRMFIWDHRKYFDNDYMSETHHLILLCTKFDCPPDTDDRPMSILHDTGEGSRYDQFVKIIERLYTEGNKLELFMDKKREGWELFKGDGED